MWIALSFEMAMQSALSLLDSALMNLFWHGKNVACVVKFEQRPID
jgi:hypothetical protein